MNADIIQQAADRAHLKAIAATGLASPKASSHLRGAKLKADQAKEKEKELAERSRIAHKRGQMEIDSRAFAGRHRSGHHGHECGCKHDRRQW